jgi:hypothetical protein
VNLKGLALAALEPLLALGLPSLPSLTLTGFLVGARGVVLPFAPPDGRAEALVRPVAGDLGSVRKSGFIGHYSHGGVLSA